VLIADLAVLADGRVRIALYQLAPEAVVILVEGPGDAQAAKLDSAQYLRLPRMPSCRLQVAAVGMYLRQAVAVAATSAERDAPSCSASVAALDGGDAEANASLTKRTTTPEGEREPS